MTKEQKGITYQFVLLLITLTVNGIGFYYATHGGGVTNVKITLPAVVYRDLPFHNDNTPITRMYNVTTYGSKNDGISGTTNKVFRDGVVVPSTYVPLTTLPPDIPEGWVKIPMYWKWRITLPDDPIKPWTELVCKPTDSAYSLKCEWRNTPVILGDSGINLGSTPQFHSLELTHPVMDPTARAFKENAETQGILLPDDWPTYHDGQKLHCYGEVLIKCEWFTDAN